MGTKAFDKQHLVDAILMELSKLPDGTDISTSDALDRAFQYQTYDDGVYFYNGFQIDISDFFEIDLRVRKQAHIHNLILDNSKSAGMVLGLPFHIPYTVKHKKLK